MQLQTLIAVDMSDIDAQDDRPCCVIPAKGTVEKARDGVILSEAKDLLSLLLIDLQILRLRSSSE